MIVPARINIAMSADGVSANDYRYEH